MMAYLWIALGSALGGAARHWMNVVIGNRYGASFPWGTLSVNVVGAVLIGAVSALALTPGRFALSQNTAQFWMAGVLGGFTTFSAFSLQTVQLLQTSRWLAATLYAAASVLLCLAGVVLGQILVKAVR